MGQINLGNINSTNSKHGHHTSESLVNCDAILNIITRCIKEDIIKDDLVLQFEKLDSAFDSDTENCSENKVCIPEESGSIINSEYRTSAMKYCISEK